MSGTTAGQIQIVLKAVDQASGPMNQIAKSTETSAKSMRLSLGGVVKAAAGMLAIVGGFRAAKSIISGAINDASDLNESLSKNVVLFGDSSKQIENFASSTAQNFGISKNAALEATGVYGNLFRSMDIAQPVAADMSQTLVGLAGDMASFNNADPSQVLAALQSGLVGETMPLRQFGVNINQAQIAQEALNLGISDGIEPLTAAQKAQATYALILDQTKLAQGDFARTSSGLANSTRILKARLADVSAQLGTVLLPIATQAVSLFARALPYAVSGVSATFHWLQRTLAGPLHTAFVLIRDSVITLIQALSGNWTDNSKIEGVHRVIGNIGLVIRNQVIPAIQTMAAFIVRVVVPAFQALVQNITGTIIPAVQQFAAMTVQFVEGQVIPAFLRIRDMVVPVLEQIIGLLRDNWQSVMVGAGAILVAVVIPAFIAWAVAAGAAAVATITAISPVLLVLAAIGIAAGALYLAWSSNFLNIQGIVAAVWEFIRPILEAIIANLQQFITDILPQVIQLWGEVRDGVILAVNAIAEVVMPVFAAIADFVQAHSDQIKQILSGVWDVISGIIKVDVDIIEGVIKVFLDLVTGNWGKAWDDIKTMFSNIWTDMGQIVRGAKNILIGEVQILIDGIKSIFSGAKDWLLQAGYDIVQGLADGIRSAASSVLSSAVSAVADQLPQWFKDLWGIKSPSTVMIEIGQNLIAGLAEGLNHVEALTQSATSVSSAVVAAMITGITNGDSERTRW